MFVKEEKACGAGELQVVWNYLSKKFKAGSGGRDQRVNRHQVMEGLKWQAEESVLCPMHDKEH